MCGWAFEFAGGGGDVGVGVREAGGDEAVAGVSMEQGGPQAQVGDPAGGSSGYLGLTGAWLDRPVIGSS